jgi:hypothetical protein
MKKSYIILFSLVVLNIFSCKSLPYQEFTLIFSIDDLEKYLGEPAPENATQISLNFWTIELSSTNFIKENINLSSRNGLVTVAEYFFVSDSYDLLSALRESLFHIIDENGENKELGNDVIDWDLKPNSGLKNNKYLAIGLTDVLAVKNNEIWTLSVRILDLNNLERK